MRFIIASPYFLIVFFLIPGTLILSRVFHVHPPFPITTAMLLGNNICLLVALLVRLVRCLAVKGGGMGHAGTSLIYGGLFLMLLIGVWDNLRQFSGTIIQGPGAGFDLSKSDNYYHLIAGPLAFSTGLPSLKVTRQVFPDDKYPMGGTEISLFNREEKRVGGAFLDAAKGPYGYGGYDIYLNGLLADAALTIKTNGSAGNDVFDDAVKLRPLYGDKVGDFTLAGTFNTRTGDDGVALYDPAHNIFRITLTHAGKKVMETDYQFQGGYREKQEGKYVASILGMGHWSEIHVVRRRHMGLIIAGAIVAALGVVMRIGFRRRLKTEG
ncbi:MAG TPA: hypothetical protein VI298_03035 [Geobacteraceae bacterium]